MNGAPSEVRVYIFHRAEGWYPLTLPINDDLAAHAARNPGTVRIEDIDGNVLWRARADA